VSKFLSFLKLLGVISNVMKKELKVEYDEQLREYLLKDRQIDELPVHT